ncbi:hypothetical protein G7046_g741 [Stylonectria norvegica]|nr:hypothetical protein G7046_g741 [Stylonectria norvegica]
MSTFALDREKGALAGGTLPTTSISETAAPGNNKIDLTEKPKSDAIGEKSQDETEYPKGLPLFFIILALIMGIFLASLDMTIVATAIPKITDEFGGLDRVSWYGSAFFMTNGGFQSSWGKAYKYFSIKTTFIMSVLVFELGSLICGVSPNSTALIVGRAITGLGAAGIGTGTYTIIAFVTEPQNRPMYTGVVGVSYGFASVIGPLLGGVFAEKATWRWCFYINLPIGGISALVIFFFFHTPSGAKPVEAPLREKLLQMDPVGVALMIGALVSYIIALQDAGQSKPWGSSTVVGLLVGCVATLIVFGIWENSQGERAMVVPRLIKQRAIITSSLFAIFFSGSYFSIIYYLPIYFQSVHNVSPTMSGVYNLPLIVSVTFAMISSGIFITATGWAVPVSVFGAATALVGTGLLYTFGLNTKMDKWIGYQIIAGIGWGAAYQIPIIASQAGADAKDISSITALILFCMNLGGTAFVTAAQSIFVNDLVSTLPHTSPGVDPSAVVATGATEIRNMFSADDVPGIVASYMGGVKNTFILAVCAVGASLIVSVFGKWERMKSAATTETEPVAL